MGIWNLKPLVLTWFIISSIIIGTGIYIDRQVSSFEYDVDAVPLFRIETYHQEPLVNSGQKLLHELNDLPTINQKNSVIYWEHLDKIITNTSIDSLVQIIYVNQSLIDDINGLDFPVLYDLPMHSNYSSVMINLIAEEREFIVNNLTVSILLPEYLNQITASLGQTQLPLIFMSVSNITNELNSFEHNQKTRNVKFTTGINIYLNRSMEFSTYEEFLDHYDNLWKLSIQTISSYFDDYKIYTPLLNKITLDVSYGIFLASYITQPIMLFLIILEIFFIVGFGSMIMDLKRIYTLLESRGISRKTLNMKLYSSIIGYHLLFSSLVYVGVGRINSNSSFINEMQNFILPTLIFFVLSSTYTIIHAMRNLNEPFRNQIKRFPMKRLLDLVVILSLIMFSLPLLTKDWSNISKVVSIDFSLVVISIILNLLYRKQFVLVNRTAVMNKMYIDQYRFKKFIVMISILGIILVSMIYSASYIEYQYGSSIDGYPPHPLFADLEGTIELNTGNQVDMRNEYRLIANRLSSVLDFYVIPVITLGVLIGDAFTVIHLLNETHYNIVAEKMGMKMINFTGKIFMNQGMYDSLVQSNKDLKINDYDKQITISNNSSELVGPEFGIRTNDHLFTSVSTWETLGFSLFHRLGYPDGLILDLIINSRNGITPRDAEIQIINTLGISDSRVVVSNIDNNPSIQATSQNIKLLYIVLVFTLILLNIVIIANIHEWEFMEGLKNITSRFGVFKLVILSELLVTVNLLLVSLIGIFLGLLSAMYWLSPSIPTVNVLEFSIYPFMEINKFISDVTVMLLLLSMVLSGIIIRYNVIIRKMVKK